MDRKGPSSALLLASIGGKDGVETAPEDSRPSACFERHYEPTELGALWGLSPDEIRKIFENEPGVLVIENSGPMRGKRRYRTLRIPASVAERVHRRLSVVKGERFPLTGQRK